jgi:hypothetical protein
MILKHNLLTLQGRAKQNLWRKHLTTKWEPNDMKLLIWNFKQHQIQ